MFNSANLTSSITGWFNSNFTPSPEDQKDDSQPTAAEHADAVKQKVDKPTSDDPPQDLVSTIDSSHFILNVIASNFLFQKL